MLIRTLDHLFLKYQHEHIIFEGSPIFLFDIHFDFVCELRQVTIPGLLDKPFGNEGKVLERGEMMLLLVATLFFLKRPMAANALHITSLHLHKYNKYHRQLGPNLYLVMLLFLRLFCLNCWPVA